VPTRSPHYTSEKVQHLDQEGRSRWRLQVNIYYPEPISSLFDQRYQNGSHTCWGPRASADRVIYSKRIKPLL